MEKNDLIESMAMNEFTAGEIIFKAGDAGDVAYMVLNGKIEISRTNKGDKVIFGEVEPGGIFGEMALISQLPRMATAIATEDTKCILIPPETLEKELEELSTLMKTLVLTLMGHVRNVSDKLEASRAAPSGGKEWFLEDFFLGT